MFQQSGGQISFWFAYVGTVATRTSKFVINTTLVKYKHNIHEIPSQNDSSDDIRPRIWLRIPFMGKQGEFLVKKLLKKIQRNLVQPVKFVLI